MKTIKKYSSLVYNCLGCPACHQSSQDEGSFAYGDFSCTKCENREIDSIDYDSFPEWCPLENVKICPMCFEKEVGINTDGLCEGCFSVNKKEELLDIDAIGIDSVDFWSPNELCKGGMRIHWTSNEGFGTLDIVKREGHDGDNLNEEYEELKLTVDSEYMATQDNKSFIEKILKELVKKLIVTS